MALSETSYSRVVAWLKVILPITAVGLLSTVFLFSRNYDAGSSIPYSTIDLRDAARSERISRPSFAGATEKGDLIAFTADSAHPEVGSRLDAENLSARIDLVSGGNISFTADNGLIDQPSDTASLRGGVVITASTGYRVETDALDAGMQDIRAETQGPVSAIGPPGTFTAGHMKLTTDPDSNDAYLVFTDGVKLVYDPRKIQE